MRRRTEVKGDNPDPANHSPLARRGTGTSRSIDTVDDKDIEITKDDGGVQMHVAYDDSAPYIANVSLTVHFDKTVKVQ